MSSENNNLLVMIAYNQRKRRTLIFISNLHLAGRTNRDHQIPRRALHQPSFSTFFILFGRGCERSLITQTGINHHTSSCIMDKLVNYYDIYSPYSNYGKILLLPLRSIKREMPRLMSSTQCSSLFLVWNRTRGYIIKL